MNQSRRIAFLVVIVALVAGCAPDEGTSPPEDSTTSTAAPDTTTTTAAPTTSTTATTTTTTTVPADDGSVQADLPETWVGVTTDYEAVEVDTATGEILRSLGQVSTADDVENAECSACVNAIDAVWRTFDGSHLLISECCEPAAGYIHVLGEDQIPLTLDTEDDPLFFWTAAPSPQSALVAFLGYQFVVVDLDERGANAAADASDSAVVSVELDRFPVSNATWTADGQTVQWLEEDDGAIFLRSFDLSSETFTSVEIEELSGWSTGSLAAGATGELLAVPAASDSAAPAGLVLDSDGEALADSPIPAGAQLGGYDPTGSFLIYTDDGVVHWMGSDGGGDLAEGYLYASW